jgi:hypothetical protein
LNHIQSAQAIGRRWGVWWTLGFSLVIAVVFIIVQLVVAGVVSTVQLQGKSEPVTDAYFASLETNGLFLSLATVASSLLCTGLIVLFAALRRGITVSAYLDLRPLPFVVLARWIGITVIFALAADGLWLLLNRPLVPEFMIQAYQSAGNYPLFWFAIVVAGPVFEEVFFRGFLFEGLRESKLGSVGAVVATSVAWAAIHLQYEIFEITLILFLGLLLGTAKIKTRSIYTTVAMHGLVNLIAMAQVAALLWNQ